MKSIVISTIIFVLASSRLNAQTNELGSWNILNLKYTTDDKLSFFAEAQLRSLKLYSDFHYYEYKAGASYKVHKNAAFAVCAGSYQTYKEGGDFVLPKNNNEFRVWSQMTLFQSLSSLKIEQRYRTEFRFTSNGYRNRFRYRLGLSYPFGSEVNKKYKPYQLNVSNELFFTTKEPYFERNRLLLAFSYKPSQPITLQVGYLRQFDYKINDETGRNFLQIGFYLDLFRKPSAVENNNGAEIKDN